jgi:hypothetical protein
MQSETVERTEKGRAERMTGTINGISPPAILFPRARKFLALKGFVLDGGL